MTLAMSITNFAIYVAILFGFELYLKKRATRDDVFFLATEEKWYKILMLILGGSVFVVDILAKEASFFVYTVLFLSYTFTFKEIGAAGIVSNLRRIPLKDIKHLSLEEKTHGFHVRYELKNRSFEMIVRKSMAAGLHEAVDRAERMIANQNK